MNAVLTLFLLGFAIDTLFAWYILSVKRGQKLRAAILSVGIAAPAVFGTLEIYDDRVLAIPYFFGLFCGTMFAMSISKVDE